MTERAFELVLVVHDESEATVATLIESLPASWPQDRPTSVHVVDNASSSDIAAHVLAALATRLPAVFARLTRMPVNVGFGRAVNAGASASKAAFIGVFNPDGALERDTLERLLLTLEADAGLLAASAELLPFGAPVTSSEEPVNCEWCPGGATIYRRSSFAQLGGFDPLFFLWGEDVDLGARARARGLRQVIVPGAVFRHEIGDSDRRRTFRRYRLFAKHEMAIQHIHHGPAAAARWLVHLHWWSFRNLLLQSRRVVAPTGVVIGAWAYLRIARTCNERRRHPWGALQR